MNSPTGTLAHFLVDEDAATSIEYGLIAMVVSVGIIVSLQYFAASLNNLWGMITSTVLGAL